MISSLISAVPVLSIPSARAAAGRKSTMRPLTKGPRSSTVTTIDGDGWSCRVILSLVPNGSVRCATVMSVLLSTGLPLALVLSSYQLACPTCGPSAACQIRGARIGDGGRIGLDTGGGSTTVLLHGMNCPQSV